MKKTYFVRFKDSENRYLLKIEHETNCNNIYMKIENTHMTAFRDGKAYASAKGGQMKGTLDALMYQVATADATKEFRDAFLKSIESQAYQTSLILTHSDLIERGCTIE
jgi:hypothetical protein